MKLRSLKSFLSDPNSQEKPNLELRFYSGYKHGETPRAVVVGNREFKIDEILWRKRVFNQNKEETSEVFRCRIEGETVKITIYESGEWTVSFSEKA